MTLAGVGIGALVLIALEVFASSNNTPGLLSLAAEPAKLAAAWMNPAVPLIPAGGFKSASSASTSTTATA